MKRQTIRVELAPIQRDIETGKQLFKNQIEAFIIVTNPDTEMEWEHHYKIADILIEKNYIELADFPEEGNIINSYSLWITADKFNQDWERRSDFIKAVREVVKEYRKSLKG